MFKVIGAEIKKMVSKPGIYILAAFLAVILVLGVFIYKPEVKTSTDVSTSFTEGFRLTGDRSYEDLIKNKNDANIAKTLAVVNSYSQTHTEEGNLVFNEKLDNYIEARGQLSGAVTYMGNTEADQKSATDKFMQTITDINNFLRQDIGSDTNPATGLQSFAIFTSDANRKKFSEYYGKIYEAYNSIEDSGEVNKYKAFYENYENNFLSAFDDTLNKYYFPVLPSETIADYTTLLTDKGDTKYGTLTKHLNEIDTAIRKLFVNSDSLSYSADGSKVDQFIQLVNEYQNTANSYIYMVKYELMSNAFKSLSTKNQHILTDLTNETEFSANTNLIKYQYMFDHNKVEEDFSSPLAVGTTIGAKISAYDYAYFILRLFSIVILAYAIMSACHTIAGEIKEGSMRYFAIRPISRGNILFGKLLSIIIMTILMLLFSTIIALVVGGGVYGFGVNNILTIFNGKTAMVIQPLGMLCLYLLSFIVQIVIYSSIALMLSTLIKSDLLSITIMLLIYILNLLLPVFAGGLNSWLMFYPFSHISFFALFGSSLFANSSDLLSRLLAENVYAGTSLVTISIVSLVLIIVPLVISKLAFKNKEL